MRADYSSSCIALQILSPPELANTVRSFMGG